MLYVNGLKIQPFSKISQNTAMNRYNLIKRLQVVFKEAGISEAELARRANMNQPTVHRILSGESTDPRLSNLEGMAAALGYSLFDLFREDKTGERMPSYISGDQDTVPHLTIREINEGKATKDTVKCPFKHGLGTYAVTVEGTAMSASYSVSQTYPEGSIIFVDPTLANKVQHMDIVPVTLPESSNMFAFRRLQIEAGQQYLVPINPQFPPMIGVPFKIIGKVIGALLPH